MSLLKQKLSVIDSVVPRGSKVVYLDIPLHLNVGDLLIYKGTEQFFKEQNYKVLARRTDKSSLKYVEETRSLPADTIILLHGGGNFGDLYVHHQRLREAVVKKFPNNKVVFLPQTLHFEDHAELIKSGNIIRSHKDLTIFCRDERSFKIFKEHFCDNVVMCPDMAHALWGVFPNQERASVPNETLWMIRKDIEGGKVSGEIDLPSASEYEDWEDICNDKDRKMLKILERTERINKTFSSGLIGTSSIWENYTDKLVSRVNNYFMSYDTVVTSRMHGHILCCLLGVKTKLLDNSYGKNSGYYQAWTKDVPECELITL
ncbi:polysaccharide pyruvyl transferase family protein [Erwiniaceae bacterium BAC15a-03b]|uniref:Polysaccharide pyruvyl transferase family protein n=1 Tax=Winslowiella arboricola TaxID=2978220 RepID=A0A9J6PVJ0_9GAMM|nr:polysaccharide pyruvyl transferase family protein [Winslowiella arboricola]MCU5774281.1 polysaccharide pyruvyl transferase family protein [Winslowiella arboricola]MCU5778828.1 polysaccharide pyruvyl transferase family protein [Winslowiella arboricola]